MGEQAVAVLREGRGVENPLVVHPQARRTSETACRTPAVRPIAAPSRSNRKAAEAKLAAGAPAGWTGARSARKAPKTSGRAQPKPVRLSPHRSQRVLRRDARLDVDVRETTLLVRSSPRIDPLAIRSSQASGNSRESNKHQRLLGRLFQQPARRREATSRRRSCSQPHFFVRAFSRHALFKRIRPQPGTQNPIFPIFPVSKFVNSILIISDLQNIGTKDPRQPLCHSRKGEERVRIGFTNDRPSKAMR